MLQITGNIIPEKIDSNVSESIFLHSSPEKCVFCNTSHKYGKIGERILWRIFENLSHVKSHEVPKLKSMGEQKNNNHVVTSILNWLKLSVSKWIKENPLKRCGTSHQIRLSEQVILPKMTLSQCSHWQVILKTNLPNYCMSFSIKTTNR